MSRVTLTNGPAPDSPSAGKSAVYVKSDGLLYIKDENGTEKQLAHSDSGWRCVQFSPNTANNLTGSPTYEVLGPGSTVLALALAVADSFDAVLTLPADAKTGGNTLMALTYTTSGTDTNTIEIESYRSHANLGDALSANVQVDDTITPGGTAWVVERTIIVPSADLTTEPFSTFLYEISRVANGGTDNTDNFFPLSLELWYEAGDNAAEAAPS